MIFFDDNNWSDNLATARSCGVKVTKATPNGVQIEEFEAAIAEYSSTAS